MCLLRSFQTPFSQCLQNLTGLVPDQSLLVNYVTRYTDLAFTDADAILFVYIFPRLYNIFLAKNVSVFIVSLSKYAFPSLVFGETSLI